MFTVSGVAFVIVTFVVGFAGNLYPSGASVSVTSYVPTSKLAFILPLESVVYSCPLIVNLAPSKGVFPSSLYFTRFTSLATFL